jgi:hypothetical protein
LEQTLARIVFTLAEWRSVAQELHSPHYSAAPAGLHERLHELVKQAPQDWHDQPFALELDESSVKAVWDAHAALTQGSPYAQEQEAGIAEASRIIHRHQHETDSPSSHDKETS